MKKTELKNCPQWLLDADTENEDVSLDEYGILQWHSGDFRGGNFRGGDFWGGDFLGGNFHGGNFLGEKLDRNPVSVYGIGAWGAVITPTMLHIGCQHHTHAEWRAFTEDQIETMAEGATEFWEKNREILLAVCDRESAN